MHSWYITVHNDAVENDDEYLLEIEKVLRSAENFKLNEKESVESDIVTLASLNYRFFSHTFNVNNKYVVNAYGESDYAFDIYTLFFECDSVSEELAKEFVKAFEEYYKTEFYYKMNVKESVDLEIYKK